MNIAWIVLFLPLISAAVIHFGLKKNGSLGAIVGTAATLAGLVCVLMLKPAESADAPSFTWLSVPGVFDVSIGLTLDKLSIGMMLVVALVGTLVHVFSLGYMKSDEAKGRYFGNLSLFMFSMTGIVLADNFVMTFIFWELVGLSSYLLIGHWYQKDSAGEAAKKAFLTNRIGDFGFMIGILMLWGITDHFTFSGLDQFFDGSNAKVLVPSVTVLGTAIFMIFCGAMGKSAQAPLHVWLPDAMEGPTPVSALIHAATMVAAGVYMMARLFTSIGLDTLANTELWSMSVIAWIGGITSLLAALMATQQDDIKKILAYSTLSQLGYMVMAIGLADPGAGMFHLYTHAWFKALLFLGSGAVIYACHHEQNIWKMGGLMGKMKITAYTFLFGTLCLTAVPMTSGFFSKEGILMAAAEKDKGLLVVALVVAALTTFYMFRLFIVAFLGKAKDKHAEDAKEVNITMALPLVVLALVALVSPWMVDFIPRSLSWNYDIPNKFHVNGLVIASVAAFIVGAGAAFVLYKGKESDPLANNAIMKVFRNKFYIDEIYAKLVKIFQDIVAAIVHFLDEFLIGGLIVGGSARAAAGFGSLFRRYLQSGNLQGYAFLFALGIILAVFFTVFAH